MVPCGATSARRKYNFKHLFPVQTIATFYSGYRIKSSMINNQREHDITIQRTVARITTGKLRVLVFTESRITDVSCFVSCLAIFVANWLATDLGSAQWSDLKISLNAKRGENNASGAGTSADHTVIIQTAVSWQKSLKINTSKFHQHSIRQTLRRNPKKIRNCGIWASEIKI